MNRAILLICLICCFGKDVFSYDSINLEKVVENLKKDVKILSIDIGERNFVQYENLEKAAGYIRKEFENFGYITEEHIYYLERKLFRNIIATKQAKLLPDKIIIVCAHYDSVFGSPGADDNASGVAGLLELARLLQKDNLNKTVKFIATTNEEPPFFTTADMGSLRYAKEARQKGSDIEAVLCLESIGYYSEEKNSQGYPLGFKFFYPDRGNFIGIVSNFNSGDLLKRIVKEFRSKSSFPVEYLIAPIFLAPAISFSDNWSFWQKGYKAVMITDTAFYRNPYYHTHQDIPEKLNYEYMSHVIEGLYYVLLELSK